jgi:type IV secretory pathway TraG/TraD family ATPase VirD4
MSRVLSDKTYRSLKLSKCKNPLIKQFWENAERTSGEQGLANYVQYVTNKFDVFLANEIMRPVIAQEKSSFNFREIMDNKKILLVNLSKGRLGDINANLLGLILVGKILLSALSRTDSFGKDLPPFYLYIDEFQNITTDSIATILSEARKYKLSLNIAHQFIAQLEEGIANAVFGNVGSICAFRVGAEDSEALEKQFAPTFTASDLMNIDNRNAYLRLLVNGKPAKPFNMEVLPPPQGKKDQIESLKELSYQKFGRPLEEVEKLILEKYKVV